MCPPPVGRGYAAACEALESLIGTHYRPTGRDAAESFKNLGVWAQVRASASWQANQA